MGGQRKGLQEVQLKRAKRAQKRSNRKSGASSVVADTTAVRKLSDADENADARVKNEKGLGVRETTSQRPNHQETEKKGESQEIKSKDCGSSRTVGGEEDEGQSSTQKTDVGLEKAEGPCNAESTMTARVEEMNGSSKLEATSNTPKLERSRNSGTVASSLPIDSTCYAPTCTLNNPEGKSEATSNLCYSPSCRYVSFQSSQVRFPNPLSSQLGKPDYALSNMDHCHHQHHHFEV